MRREIYRHIDSQMDIEKPQMENTFVFLLYSCHMYVLLDSMFISF